MERAKLKLTVIILLLFLNVFLLGLVLGQNRQAQSYEQEGRNQAVVYLENHGITVEGEIPWDGKLLDSKTDPKDLLPDPATQLGSSWEILPMRQPETLLVDFVRCLEESGQSCGVIRSVEESYLPSDDGIRTVLTPVWVIETDTGTYRLNCAEGQLIGTMS